MKKGDLVRASPHVNWRKKRVGLVVKVIPAAKLVKVLSPDGVHTYRFDELEVVK
jgi:hypothetical protein